MPLRAEILDFISQGGLLATSPLALQTMLEFKSFFWRLKILPLLQQEALPSLILRGQPAWVPPSSQQLPSSLYEQGKDTVVFTERISENTVCISIQNACVSNLLFTKHFGNILFCILAVVLSVSYSPLPVSQGLSSGSQLSPVRLAAAETPVEACRTNSMPPGSAFCFALSKRRVRARTNKLA